MKIAIAYPALPPVRDAIGEHTVRLAESLREHATVQLLTAQSDWIPVADVDVRPALRLAGPHRLEGLREAVEAQSPDWLLLQYMPFSYGRWGLNLSLPQAVRAIRRRQPKTRMALMVHEPFVEAKGLKSLVMTAWQRWQLREIGRAMDVIFVSIQPWAEQLARWFKNRPVVHLPIGSNIPESACVRADARRSLHIPEGRVVLGIFGRAAHGRMMGHVADAFRGVHRAGYAPRLLCIGEVGTSVSRALPDADLQCLGRLPAPEVSMALHAVDIGLAPFDDGVSCRRGSFVAMLQHGIPTVGTVGHLTDPCLAQEAGRSILLAPVESPKAFADAALTLAAAPDLRVSVGQAGRALHARLFAWDRITDRFLNTLESVAPDRGDRT
jgi:glycosyltransferase involved in cell wall biosynthesis